MSSIRAILLGGILASCASCTIVQYGYPVVPPVGTEATVCVVGKMDVRRDFRNTLHDALVARGLNLMDVDRTLPNENCSLRLIYDAKYSRHGVLYLAWAEIKVLRKDRLVGEAHYSAPSAGWPTNSRMYDSTTNKVDTMVSQIFPR